MIKLIRLIFILSLAVAVEGLSQSTSFRRETLEPVGVTMSLQKLNGRSVVQVVKNASIKAYDEPTFVKLKGIEFKDGTIDVDVLSKLRPDAPAHARGFIGIAFRINDLNTQFECIYIRPTNGRADDQVRRNHSIQYFSYPDYKFDKLRKESPEKYESYADMGLNEWIKIRIEVKGAVAKLYLNNNKEPALIVNDLKLGSDNSGSVGMFVDIGTEGYFSDLKISK